MEKYAYITDSLKYLETTYSVQVCVKDFIGFVPINKDLERALEPFLAHTSPYCMFVKRDKQRYKRCLCGMRPMYNKCAVNPDGFFGLCHAGVHEYIMPILLGGEVLGSLSIGSFPGQEKRAQGRMNKLFEANDELTRRVAVRLFAEQINGVQTPVEQLTPILKLLCAHLAQTYAEFKTISTDMRSQRAKKNQEQDIVASAIQYIQQNYTSRISVKQIANTCHCCESYINHTFCRYTGVNVSTYINKVRVEHAKNYLISSNHRIVEIASMVGFCDPNYFSRVFTELMGIPPTEFRRRYTA